MLDEDVSNELNREEVETYLNSNKRLNYDKHHFIDVIVFPEINQLSIFNNLFENIHSSLSDNEKIETINSFLGDIKNVDKEFYMINNYYPYRLEKKLKLKKLEKNDKYISQFLYSMVKVHVESIKNFKQRYYGDYFFTVDMNFLDYLILHMLPIKYFKDMKVFERDISKPLPLTDESTGETGYNYGNDFELYIEFHDTFILFRKFGETILTNVEQFKKLWSRVHEEEYEYSFREEEDTVEIVMKQIIENQNNDTIVFENMKKLKYFCFLNAKNLNGSGGLIDHEFTDMNFYCRLDRTCDPERDNQNPLQMFVYSLLLTNLEKEKDSQCLISDIFSSFCKGADPKLFYDLIKLSLNSIRKIINHTH